MNIAGIRTMIILGLLACWTFASANANDIGAKIEYHRGKVGTLIVSPALAAKLNTSFPGFQIFKPSDFVPEAQNLFINLRHATPAAMIGHFRDKSQLDLVVMGHDSQNQLVLEVASTAAGFEVTKIQSSLYQDPQQTVYPPVDPSTPADSGVIEQHGLYQYLSVGQKMNGLDMFQIETLYGPTVAYYFNVQNGDFSPAN